VRNSRSIEHMRQAETQSSPETTVGQHSLVPEINPTRTSGIVENRQHINSNHSAHKTEPQRPENESSVPNVRVVDHGHAKEHQNYCIAG